MSSAQCTSSSRSTSGVSAAAASRSRVMLSKSRRASSLERGQPRVRQLGEEARQLGPPDRLEPAQHPVFARHLAGAEGVGPRAERQDSARSRSTGPGAPARQISSSAGRQLARAVDSCRFRPHPRWPRRRPGRAARRRAAPRSRAISRSRPISGVSAAGRPDRTCSVAVAGRPARARRLGAGRRRARAQDLAGRAASSPPRARRRALAGER